MTDDAPEVRPLVRRTINLNPKAEDALQRSSRRDELSRTDVVNKSITFYDAMMEEIHTAGSDLLIRRPDGTLLQVCMV